MLLFFPLSHPILPENRFETHSPTTREGDEGVNKSYLVCKIINLSANSQIFCRFYTILTFSASIFRIKGTTLQLLE